jgi:hypothetical protein
MTHTVAYQIQLTFDGVAWSAYDVIEVEGKPHAVVDIKTDCMAVVPLNPAKIFDLPEEDFFDGLTRTYRGKMTMDQAFDLVGTRS